MLKHLLAVLPACLVQLPVAHAEIVHLAPVADTCFRNTAPNTNFGASSPLYVGLAKEPFTITNRGVLKFEFSSIPTNATILNVSLTIVMALSNTDPSYFDLNRMLSDWDEYEATWDIRKAGTPWASPGCQRGTDFVSAPSATGVIDEVVFSSPGMVADAQLWLTHPGTNFGWMMIATGEPFGTGKQVGSRESSFAPVLTVEYTLSAPVTPPEIFGPIIAANEFRFSFNAQSNRAYTVEFRDLFASGDWNVLTTFAAQPVDRSVNISNTVSSPARYFRVRTP